MKCFIHRDEEAVAACKICGKAMCIDCSAYSAHSGICPECRREEFIKEKATLNSEVDRLKGRRAGAVALSVLLVIFAIVLSVMVAVYCLALLVLLLFTGFRFLICNSQIKEKQARIDFLTKEIEKLNSALANGDSTALK